jgi:hypothetical protein
MKPMRSKVLWILSVVMCMLAVQALTAPQHVAWAQAVPVTGNWTLYYDWDCDGSYNSVSIIVNAGGTFTTGSGYSGLWVQEAGMLLLTINNSETTYAGNLASRSITGISTTFAGLNGCFYMLQAGVPTAFAIDEPEPADEAGDQRQ